MPSKDIVSEETIKTFLVVNDAKLASLRSGGLPFIDMGDNYRLYNIENVSVYISNWEYFSGERTKYFAVDFDGTAYNGYPKQTILTNSAGDFGFQIPPDFGSLTSIKLLCIPEAGAAGAAKSFDLESNYGGIGESCTMHNETDAANSQTLAAGGGIVGELNLASVFSDLSASDVCAVNVKHNSIGGSVHYLAIELKYAWGAP